jgi:1-acyl-sn-glycerol-3-phosphate acyltransferase
MAFPEGQRSSDGHLMDFKGGLFLMAVKTKVPIVPITLSHTHSVMPSNSLFPIQSGAGKLHVHVHDPIDAEGKTDQELSELVRASFLQTLPLEQHPHEPIPSREELEALSNENAPAVSKNETVAV